MFPFDNKAVRPALEKANEATRRDMRLNVSAAGGDADTFGTNTVLLMDSRRFDFFQGELCLQFHNNQTGKYPAEYHALREDLLRSGRLRHSGCPPNYICNATMR